MVGKNCAVARGPQSHLGAGELAVRGGEVLTVAALVLGNLVGDEFGHRRPVEQGAQVEQRPAGGLSAPNHTNASPKDLRGFAHAR